MVRIKALLTVVVIVISSDNALPDILIGSAATQTGRYAWFGEQSQRGIALAVEDINAAGGVLGEQVTTFFGDDACDPEQGAVLAQKFLNLEVAAVMGHGCSGPALAAGPTYEGAGIITITHSASHPEITEQGWRFHFRFFGRDDEQGRLAADYIDGHHSGQNLAILYDETAYSRNLAQTLRAELTERGRQVTLLSRHDGRWFQMV